MWVGEDEEEGGDGWREMKTERGRSTGFQLVLYKCKQVVGDQNHNETQNPAENQAAGAWNPRRKAAQVWGEAYILTVLGPHYEPSV